MEPLKERGPTPGPHHSPDRRDNTYTCLFHALGLKRCKPQSHLVSFASH